MSKERAPRRSKSVLEDHPARTGKFRDAVRLDDAIKERIMFGPRPNIDIGISGPVHSFTVDYSNE